MGFLQGAYRSRLYRMYVLNAPSSISIPWGIAKSFLEKHTVDKINIIKSNTSPKMWEHFNKNQIEQKFGGSCPDLTQDFWPPKCSSYNFAIEGENQESYLVSKDEYRKLFYQGKIDAEFVYEPFLELEEEKSEEETKKI